MTPIVADAEFARQIAAASGRVGIVDEHGTPIAVCIPIKPPQPSKYTPEEIERRRKDLEPIREEIRKHPERGKSLTEVLAYLEERARETP
jgi:hypothetical protein